MNNARNCCCEMMAIQIAHRCNQHADIFDCPDALIVYESQSDEYGLIIHDGGSASITIHYCPWCGTALPGIVQTPHVDESSPDRNQGEDIQHITIVRLPTATITDWGSFDEVCQEVFGFPAFYGRNMNAWIDCLTYLDLGDGMSRFHLRPGEKLVVEVLEAKDLMRRVPDIFAGLIETTAAVNQRHIHDGKEPMIALVFL